MSDPTATPVAAPVAPAAPAAIPATPVAPVVADPNTPAAPLNVVAPEPAPIQPVEDVVVVYNKTGDPGLDIALRFVGEQGLGPEHPAVAAATKGDFQALEEALKARGDKAKGYEQYLDVAKESYKRVSESRIAKETATQAAVISVVGGKDSWNAIHAWVVAEASDEQKVSINAAFNGGEYAAVAMARQLSELYKQSGQSTAKPKSVVSDSASASAAQPGAVSPQEFKDEMKKLHAKYGTRLDTKPEYAALVARFHAFNANKGA